MSILQDLRLAFRLFRRTPAATAIALLSIALSIGATSVVFAAIRAVLIEPLPYTRSGELVQLRSEFPKMQQQAQGDWVVWNDTRELSRRTSTLGPLGVYGNALLDLAGDANTTPEALYGLRVNADLFPVLGVSPIIGRSFLPEESQAGHPDVIILSHGLWARRFHSDSSVVGETITLGGHQVLIIGVMPPEFNFPMRRQAAHTPSPYVEFWITPLEAPDNPGAGLGSVARLRPGVSPNAARQELAAISATLSRDFPERNRDRILVANLLQDRLVGQAGKGLWLLMAAAVFFMLIGCANVANLLLARGLSRRQEMTVRLAIGASRWRLARQLLTESCALAVAGGLCGYILTTAAWKLLPSVAPVSIPRLSSAHADSNVLAFSLSMAVINGLLFGMAPVLSVCGSGAKTLNARGAAFIRRDRTRTSIAATQVAISVLLVVIGGQVLESFVALVTTDPGFQAEGVLASVVLPAPERYHGPEQRALFYRRILDAVRQIPGIETAGTVDALPFSGENHGGLVSKEAAPVNGQVVAEIDVAGGDYLQTMGIKLIEGRWFREEETRASSDAAIVDTIVARRLWADESALGKRICVYCSPEHPDNWKQIIGVVSSASHIALDQAETGSVYVSGGAFEHAVFLVARTDRPLGETGQDIRRTIAAIDSNQPVFLNVPLRELIADSVADRRFIVMLLTITACLALALASAGVYGVVSYMVSRRTPEVGIRMAMGARPRDVFSLIFLQYFRIVVIGLVIGITTAWISLRFLGTVVVGTESGHPATVLAAATLVTVTVGCACWIPARRATGTDPVSALRQE